MTSSSSPQLFGVSGTGCQRPPPSGSHHATRGRTLSQLLFSPPPCPPPHCTLMNSLPGLPLALSHAVRVLSCSSPQPTSPRLLSHPLPCSSGRPFFPYPIHMCPPTPLQCSQTPPCPAHLYSRVYGGLGALWQESSCLLLCPQTLAGTQQLEHGSPTSV